MRLKPPESAEACPASGPDTALEDDLFRQTISGTPAGVREALVATRESLRARGVAADDLGTIEIVLAEVMNNIVEHAYPQDLIGPIEIEIERVQHGFQFRVTDRGLPMPGGEPPLGTPANLDVDRSDLPEGGFGWSLIHMLVSGLDYRRTEGHNILVLTIPASGLTG